MALRLSVLSLVLYLITGCSAQRNNFSTEKEVFWNNRYHQAQSDDQKVEMWQSMIHSDVLHKGINEMELIQIFGRDYMRIRQADEKKEGVAVVNFINGKNIELHESTPRIMSPHTTHDSAWCLYITLDRTNKAVDFHLGSYHRNN